MNNWKEKISLRNCSSDNSDPVRLDSKNFMFILLQQTTTDTNGH